MASIAKFDTKTKANGGREIELLDARTGQGSGVFFTVLGTDSDAYNATKTKLLRQRKDTVLNDAGGVDKSAMDAAIERDVVELLSTCVTGWRNLDDENGVDIEFSPAKAKEIIASYPLIREQLDREIADRIAFIAG